MLVTKNISSLYNGISHQPETMRLESQCSDMENCMATIVDGVYKRPPSEFIKVLDSGANANTKFHEINRDAVERYLVMFTGNGTEPIEIFDLLGNKKIVKYGHLSDANIFTADASVKAYLLTTYAPNVSLKTTTIADYTIVVNSEKGAVHDWTESIETRKNIGLVYIKQKLDQTTYNVIVNGIWVSYTTVQPTDDNDFLSETTTGIAYTLAVRLMANVPGLRVAQTGSLLMLYFDDYRDFSLTVTDGYGDRASIGIMGKVSTYSDLPPQCFGTDLKQLNAPPYHWFWYAAGNCWAVLTSDQQDPRLSPPSYLRFGAEKNYNRVYGTDLPTASGKFAGTRTTECQYTFMQSPCPAAPAEGYFCSCGKTISDCAARNPYGESPYQDLYQTGSCALSFGNPPCPYYIVDSFCECNHMIEDCRAHNPNANPLPFGGGVETLCPLTFPEGCGYSGAIATCGKTFGDCTIRWPGGTLYSAIQPGQWAYGVLPSGVQTVFLRMEDDSDPNDYEDPIYWCQDNAPDMRIEVKWKDNKSNSSPYYVKYEDGNWIETRAYGLNNRLAPSSMPHRLVRLGDGSFAFCDIDWKERLVGDETTAPSPSFIGNAIDNVFFFKNRLGFLSRDKIIFSKAGDFFNLFPSTALEVLDDDPIDVSVASMEVTHLREALPFNKNLWLRSDLHQFILPGSDQPLTPKTITVDLTTRFETLPDAESCSVGSNVYFTCPSGDHLAAREYFVQPDSLTDDATDITVHVPRLLLRGNTVIKGCSPLDMFFLQSSGNLNTLYVYKYYWSGAEKPQSCWGKWVFGPQVLGFFVFETTLYLVVLRGSQRVLEKIDLKPNITSGLSFKVHLDSLCQVAGVYDGTHTTWTMPYTDWNGTYRVIHPRGLKLGTERTPGYGNRIRADGDFSGYSCWVGRQYIKVFEPSGWYLKDSKDQAIEAGSLQHRTTTLAFTNTGYFRVEVTPTSRPTLTHVWVAKRPGLITSGDASVETGEKRFMIMSRAMGKTRIRLINDSHYPSNFQSITHEGFYTSRSRTL